MSPGKRCSHGVFNDCPDCRAERERRERIACTLLSGLLSNPLYAQWASDGQVRIAALADSALHAADYLIAKLDEGKDLPS